MHPLQSIMSNAYLKATKKYLVHMLGESKYIPHDEIVERTVNNLVTRSDAEKFYSLIAEIYEAGYLKCIEQYKDKLEEHGLKVKIFPVILNF